MQERITASIEIVREQDRPLVGRVVDALIKTALGEFDFQLTGAEARAAVDAAARDEDITVEIVRETDVEQDDFVQAIPDFRA